MSIRLFRFAIHKQYKALKPVTKLSGSFAQAGISSAPQVRGPLTPPMFLASIPCSRKIRSKFDAAGSGRSSELGKVTRNTIEYAKDLGCKVYLNTECGHSTYSVWMGQKKLWRSSGRRSAFCCQSLCGGKNFIDMVPNRSKSIN